MINVESLLCPLMSALATTIVDVLWKSCVMLCVSFRLSIQTKIEPDHRLQLEICMTFSNTSNTFFSIDTVSESDNPLYER